MNKPENITKKSYKLGELIQRSDMNYIPFLYRCPKCGFHEFRIIKENDALVCVRCCIITRFLSTPSIKNHEKTKEIETKEIETKEKELDKKKDKTNKQELKDPKELAKQLSEKIAKQQQQLTDKKE